MEAFKELDAKRMYYEFNRDVRGIDLPFDISKPEEVEGMAAIEDSIMPLPDFISPLITYVINKRDEEWRKSVAKFIGELKLMKAFPSKKTELPLYKEIDLMTRRIFNIKEDDKEVIV